MSAYAGSPSSQLEAKIVLLGSQGVGKTSIVRRYTTNEFGPTSSTIGASFTTQRMVIDSVRVRLQLWDTAGQERFRSMAPIYYRGASAAVVVYDITDMQSFVDARRWIDELRQEMPEDLIITVVGSKLDLADRREVSLTEAKKTVRSWFEAHTSPALLSPDASGRLRPQISKTMLPMDHPLKSPKANASRDSSDTLEEDTWDVVEVSALDASGVEDLFLDIARKLVETRDTINKQKAARQRDSVYLGKQSSGANSRQNSRPTSVSTSANSFTTSGFCC